MSKPLNRIVTEKVRQVKANSIENQLEIHALRWFKRQLSARDSGFRPVFGGTRLRMFLVCAGFLFGMGLFNAVALRAQTSMAQGSMARILLAQTSRNPIAGEGEAEKWFDLGIESFRWKKNGEASAYFRKAVELGPLRDEYFFYLGVAEHEQGLFESAESTYSRGIELKGSYAERLRLNRANLRMRMGRVEQANEDYSALVNGTLRVSALLGRANLNLQESSFKEAAKDYREYLRLDPASRQRSTIEKILALLESRFAEEEEAERVARQRAFEEERRRLAEEARLAEEEARRRRLLDEVLESLSGSGEDTTSIEAGNEELREDFEDSELEE